MRRQTPSRRSIGSVSRVEFALDPFFVRKVGKGGLALIAHRHDRFHHGLHRAQG